MGAEHIATTGYLEDRLPTLPPTVVYAPLGRFSDTLTPLLVLAFVFRLWAPVPLKLLYSASDAHESLPFRFEAGYLAFEGL